MQRIANPYRAVRLRFAPPTSFEESNAGIAQLVERNLAKVEVASSRLVSRSRFLKVSRPCVGLFFTGLVGRVTELVDVADLKSAALLNGVRVRFPSRPPENESLRISDSQAFTLKTCRTRVTPCGSNHNPLRFRADHTQSNNHDDR